MANNYTQFSFEIEATPEQREWIAALHAFCRGADDWSASEKPEVEARFAAALPLIGDLFDGNLYASVDIEEAGKDKLWFHSDESGDVEYTAGLLSGLLEAFNLDTILSFTWANTCSKMRLDEFDGGAVVITRDDIRFLSPSRWIDEQITEIRAARETIGFGA